MPSSQSVFTTRDPVDHAQRVFARALRWLLFSALGFGLSAWPFGLASVGYLRVGAVIGMVMASFFVALWRSRRGALLGTTFWFVLGAHLVFGQHFFRAVHLFWPELAGRCQGLFLSVAVCFGLLLLLRPFILRFCRLPSPVS